MSVVLSEHLPLLASAPDGIQKLRGLILELAVRAKLVLQDPNDEPASELLKRIAIERSRLEAEGICKKTKARPFVSLDEQPFSLPSSWAWVNLPDVYYSISPSSNKLLSSAIQEAGAVPVVDQGKRYVAGYTDEVSMLIKIPGPVVIFGDHTTERKYVDFDFVAGADGVKILRPILQYERFFFRQIQGFQLEERGYARHFKILNDQLYALPPLAEQHRIVAKVDELMTLCDRLETEQADSASAHAKLVETLLGTLTQSRDADELATNWQRLSQHFDTLFSTEASLDALKQTVLQLAVMGKLVPQDANDEPASVALAAAFNVRRQLVKTGEIPKKVLTESPWLPERPFAAPEKWTFASFDHLAAPVPNALKAGPFGSALKKDCYVTSGYKIYGQEQVIKQNAFFGDYYISEEKFAQLQSCETRPGDLLISLVGTIGKVLVLPPDAEPGIINPRLIKMSLNLMLVCAEYVKVMLASPWVREFLFAESHGSTMDVLNLTILRSLPIPLPPLAEQHRIVAKVDELMALCDGLKADLAEARTRQARLSTTLIDAALKAA